ncbi:MAG TPA: hypothetical protein VM285_11125 [Polyangia bacterium]|nr:hypothetical protein [Polyangia bacterium]
MALDLSTEALNARVDALRTGYAAHNTNVLARNRAFLRAYAPEFNNRLGEFDQWPGRIKQEDEGHTRSSYNVTRAVVELWTSLEASEFPAVRWFEQFIPSPVPSVDEEQAKAAQEVYRAAKIGTRQVSTMREQALLGHARRTDMKRHFYRAVLKKNLYGHSWLKTVPDIDRRTFRVFSRIDPSTVYPVWSAFDDSKLDAILVATRRSAQSVNEQYPGMIRMDRDGLTMASTDAYYQPSAGTLTTDDRRWVWVEDYWALDADYEGEANADTVPTRSRVVNLVRVNGKIAKTTEYKGWRSVPYVYWVNESERDALGFSDAGIMLPIQDGINRFLSQQQDVIFGESRPKFKYRGDSERVITLGDEQVVSLEPDEDIEQIAVRLDVFPTQIHGQQLMEFMSRATGLPDVVWGRIVAAQNSGRALATAWRAVAARMVPRTQRNSQALHEHFSMWLDWMELYGWDSASDLYNGNRDFELDFPNQEPRDFQEVALNAVNRLQAGLIDTAKAMEITGEASPDEMLERVRADYMDPVLHPEKSQSFLLLQRLRQQIEMEAIQAQQQLQQQVEAQAAAAEQARTQAAQQGAPQLGEGQNGAATQAGAPANGASTKFGTLVQDGKTFNRIVDQGEIAPGAPGG